ncbi:MAG: hypothetical protein ACK526_21925, partial [Planctomyces sp.]
MQDQNQIHISENGDLQHGAATTLHAVFRFLRTVRMRSGILVVSLVISCIAGAVYYVTAERRYQSNASLHIVRVGSGVTEDGNPANGSPNHDMPTFQKLMSQDEVITRAIAKLPKKYHADLVGVPRNRWVATIQENLSVTSAFGTTVIDL